MVPSAFVGAPPSMSASSMSAVTGLPPMRDSTFAASSTRNAAGFRPGLPPELGACSGVTRHLPDLGGDTPQNLGNIEKSRPNGLPSPAMSWLHVSRAERVPAA